MDDTRYRSRKFIIASASFVAVTLMTWWGCYDAAKTGQDIAIIIGAWGVCDGAILKIYTDANNKAAKINGASD